MSKQRIIKDEIWDDEWFYDLDPVEKLVWIFLLTNARCNIAGVYKLNYKWGARMIGLDLDIMEKIVARFVRDKRLVLIEEWIIIQNFTKHQAKNPSVIAGIKRTIDELPDQVKEYMKSIVQIDDIKFTGVGTHKKKRVIERDGGACVNCKSEHLLEVDHIIPIAFGGDNNEENLQTLCRKCHRLKTKADMSRQTVPDSSTLLNSTLLNSKESAGKPDTHSQQKQKVVKGKFGELKNVLLTIEEKEKLKELYGTSAAKDYVERLSLYLGSKNKRYSSHYAVLRNWMKRDRVELVRKVPTPVAPELPPENPVMQEKVAAIRKQITSNLRKNG